MSIQHLISIDREAKLSIDTGRLKIDFLKTKETHFVATCDIAILILSNPCITLSLAVAQELAKNNAVIVFTDEKHLPKSVNLPLAVNQEGARRPFLQAKYLETEKAKSWWAQLIEAKILGQAKCSYNFDKVLSNKLKLFSELIELGDKEGKEAQAAQIYWPAFFKSLNSNVSYREKQGASDPINISLNYGYAILRAIIARGLVGAGLCLNFGVGHCRKDNPFNLAEDFIEPFRFLVDYIVWEIFSKNKIETFNKETKKQILSLLLSSDVMIAEKYYRLFNGIDFAINSFCLSLEDPRKKLLLPNQPKRQGKQPSLSLWQAEQFYDEDK